MRPPLFAMLATFVILGGCAASPPEAPGMIVAFGDSYTEGNGASRAEAYPALLATALGRSVLNKGVSGETAGEALRRLDRDVIRNDPDIVIVQFGVNEAFREYPVERCLADLETILKRISTETNASIVLTGVHFWSYQTNFDDGLRALAQKYNAQLVLGIVDGIVSSVREADNGDASLRSDKFHPNARGYALVAQRIQPAVEAAAGTAA